MVFRPSRLQMALASAAVVLAFAVAALGVAVTVGMRGLVLSTLSARLGRPVHAAGAVSVRATPAGLDIDIDGLRVDQPAWAGPGALATAPHLQVRLPWTALLGDGRLSALRLDAPTLALKRDATGRATWTVGKHGGTGHLPTIDRLVVSGGELDLTDAQRALSFRGSLATNDSSGGDRLRIAGAGLSRGDPWRLELSLPARLGGSQPLDIDMRLGLDTAAGRSALQLDARLTRADGGRLDGRLASTGPNLHDLSQLLHVPLFRTPPYALQARLEATRRAVRLTGLSGRVGASDLEGAITVTPRPDGRRIDAQVRSRSLRISDLFSVASGGQLITRQVPGHLFPDAQIHPAPLRSLTGEIDYAAAYVQPPTIPTIRSLRLRATFDHGLIATDPLAMTLAEGRMTTRFVLDARRAVPRMRFDASLQRADSAEFTRAAPSPPAQAIFDATAHLQGDGLTLPQAITDASGAVALRARGGRLQRMQADILSAQVVDGLITLLARDTGSARLVCGAADLTVSRGVARTTRLDLATDIGAVSGHGDIDLGGETLDLTLQSGAPGHGGKGPTSVHLTGPLAHPKVSLSLDNPLGMVGHMLGGLLGAAPRPSVSGDCG